MFVTVNQSFFMGLFFLVAGDLTPGSYDRKGARRFVRDRLCRLGLPLLAYAVLLDPLTNILAARSAEGAWNRLLHPQFHVGPLWFAEALLLFNLGYAVVRAILSGPLRLPRAPSQPELLAGAIGVGLAAFLVRLVLPVGTTLGGLQLGYFASYVVLFAAGCRFAGLVEPTWTLAMPWVLLAPITLAMLIAYALMLGSGSYSGGLNPDAAVYAVWEPFFAWGSILGLLVLFGRWLDKPSRGLAFLSRRAYACYIIHPPLLVGICRLLHPWSAAPAIKTLAAGTLAYAACVLVSSLLLRLPPLRRVG